MAGRPPKYQDNMPDDLIKLMSEGALDCEIYADWDISKDTFYRWLNEKDELKEAHQRGLAKCESWWTKRMRDCFLKGDDKGFKYCIAIMNNKFGWEKGTKSGDGNTTNITIGNMNVLQQLGREGLIKNIKGLLDKHKEEVPIDITATVSILETTDTEYLDDPN